MAWPTIRYGNDTDTTAGIADGMAGIHWGFDAIPTAWLAAMRGREVVQPIIERLIGPVVDPLEIGDITRRA